jgi:hypothetical protein
MEGKVSGLRRRLFDCALLLYTVLCCSTLSSSCLKTKIDLAAEASATTKANLLCVRERAFLLVGKSRKVV